MGDEPISMKPASPEQALFAEALRRETTEARAAYLDSTCAEDPRLRARVEALLRAVENAGDFLEHPPTGLGGGSGSDLFGNELHETPGEKIGRYKLLEKIGEGGCGAVYMAEQEEPVRRRVALKIIKLGMDTRSVVARFEAERQALAVMDHPNIAKVLDGGATQTGRPYFVMELVRGVPITRFCEEARLSTEERLRLFVQVCQAIQHAHQKGIIHRDLKPSNILVTVNDGTPLPKVIDFGIAKAVGQRLTDKTVFTQFHSFIGTPAYTSPEQAEMSSVDIDTRSDIYSLGVLLYELLTGSTPFDGEQLVNSGLDEMRRIIRNDQPPRPSNRLTNLAAAEARRLISKSEVRPSHPEHNEGSVRRLMQEKKHLVELVRGDLDWIVMKCLEKDRSRRYDTANGLATDILRHLRHEPVTARPPNAIYLLQKHAQRNRGVLIVVITVLLALLAGVFILATSNARFREERNQKDRALRERGAALEAARASEQQAREQLFASLQSQAQARRNSGRMGQRLDSLTALTAAARIRPAPELRDNAIAAMALPDLERGPVWEEPEADARALAYDPTYRLCARLKNDGTIVVRVVAENRELQQLASDPSTEPGTADSLDFSPDSHWLARIDQRGKLSIWQWERGKLALQSRPEGCYGLSFSPDSSQVAVGQDHMLICFELNSGKEIRRWQTHDRVYSVDFNPDGRRVAVGYMESNFVSIYDSQNGTHITDLPIGDGALTVVGWHPAGELLATGGSDSRITIWNVNTQRKIAVLEGHVEHVSSLKFHPDGGVLASTSWDGDLRLWHPSPGRLLMRVPLSIRVGFNQESGWAGVICPSKNQAQLCRIVPSTEYHTFLNHLDVDLAGLREGDIYPDGTVLAMGAINGVHLWDVALGHDLAWLQMDDTTTALFLPGGHELLTCGPFNGLRRWAIEGDPKSAAGMRIGSPRSVALPFTPSRMAKDRAGQTLALVGESVGQCMLLDLATERAIGLEMPHFNGCFVALSANGKRLATSGWHSRTVKLWEAQTGRLISELDVGLTARVFFTPDDRELIVARYMEFTFYDVNTLAITRQMPRDTGLYPGYVAFTEDGKMMAVEIEPGLIHLKEVASGRTIAKLEDPNRELSTWMSFTPDATQLIVGARYASAIHRWDLRAIRTRLKSMNLDWDWPEFTPEAPAAMVSLKKPRPVLVGLVTTSPSAEAQASAADAKPFNP
jgi:serine/threonine protein kinase/WD40 repeat protein